MREVALVFVVLAWSYMLGIALVNMDPRLAGGVDQVAMARSF